MWRVLSACTRSTLIAYCTDNVYGCVTNPNLDVTRSDLCAFGWILLCNWRFIRLITPKGSTDISEWSEGHHGRDREVGMRVKVLFGLQWRHPIPTSHLGLLPKTNVLPTDFITVIYWKNGRMCIGSLVRWVILRYWASLTIMLTFCYFGILSPLSALTFPNVGKFLICTYLLPNIGWRLHFIL